jgi:hypothetical protein
MANQEAPAGPQHPTIRTRGPGAIARSALSRRLIFPLVFTLSLIGAIELGVQLCFHPGFWQKSTWLLHDPYRGREAFERMVLYEKLTRFETAPDSLAFNRE